MKPWPKIAMHVPDGQPTQMKRAAPHNEAAIE